MNDETRRCAEQLLKATLEHGGSRILADLIRESMALAYANGMRDGVREVQAVLHTQGAMVRMRMDVTR